MNNDVVAPEPGVQEVETVAPAVMPVHSPPAAEVKGNSSSLPAGRTVTGELRKTFYWLAMR